MSELLQETHRRTRVLTLNRPDLRNALDARLIAELRKALRDAAADEAIRTVVITGAGKAFSAGADLNELKALRSASLAQNRRSSRAIASLFSEIRLHPKPVIAKVNGHAIAGGCGLAIACDIAIAANQAKLGFSEVRIGFVPAIVSQLLRGRIPDTQLRELLLTGQTIWAADAAAMGLVSSAVASDELDATVDEIAEAIAAETSPTAVSMTKRMLVAAEGMPTARAAEFLSGLNALARQTGDVVRGVSAFLEKREPRW